MVFYIVIQYNRMDYLENRVPMFKFGNFNIFTEIFDLKLNSLFSVKM